MFIRTPLSCLVSHLGRDLQGHRKSLCKNRDIKSERESESDCKCICICICKWSVFSSCTNCPRNSSFIMQVTRGKRHEEEREQERERETRAWAECHSVPRAERRQKYCMIHCDKSKQEKREGGGERWTRNLPLKHWLTMSLKVSLESTGYNGNSRWQVQWLWDEEKCDKSYDFINVTWVRLEERERDREREREKNLVKKRIRPGDAGCSCSLWYRFWRPGNSSRQSHLWT